METEWISPEQLAHELQVPLATVYAWRRKSYGPPGMKVGKHVRYRRVDVDAWYTTQLEQENP
jgi:predicted DNA-binding transcriptional regulator AlpA